MIKLTLIFLCFFQIASAQNSNQEQLIFTSDIQHFWEAYDKVTSTSDSSLKLKYLDSLFIQKGTDGLKAMRQVRNYTSQDYIWAIENHPQFWNSIRQNTLKVDQYQNDLERGIKNLAKIYPQIQRAKIYFTIGALRSNGTTLENQVLIGSELALATKETPTHEFSEDFSHLDIYFATDPYKQIVFLNLHEYIHTQQKTTIGETLLAQTVLEGAAEFLAEKVLETESPNPQISYGRKNDTKIKSKFEQEMFSPYFYNWLWNSSENEFGMRDLAYYVGYRICEAYYNKSTDKNGSIQEMIELDYNNEEDLIAFVEKSAYFNTPLRQIKDSFEKTRPVVLEVDRIKYTDSILNENREKLAIHFSQKMDQRFRGFENGPLGEKHVIRINDFLGFSEDGKTVYFGIEKLESDKKYQLVVANFMSLDGIPLIPYLIEISKN